jgi:dTMP kinase
MDTPQQHIRGGLLIVFEGMDGVGKTTQLQLVEKQLEARGVLVKTKRSPGGTPIGEALRSVLLQDIPRPPMTDLYIALAIQEALHEAIAENRQAGNVILLDRSPLSIAAYQIYGSGIDETLGWNYIDKYMKLLRPDLVIVYTCPPEEALVRAQQKPTAGDYFESMPLDYFKRVAQGYEAALQRYPSLVIDASKPVESVQAQTMSHIDQLLGKQG